MAEPNDFRSTLPFLLRIVAALLLVALIPLAWASWRLISVNQDSMEVQVRSTQTLAARSAADAIGTFVDTRRALAQSIARAPELASGDAAAVSGLLQRSLAAWSNLEIEALGVFNQNQEFILGTRVTGSQLELGQWMASVGDREVALEPDQSRVLIIVREPIESGGFVLLLGDTNRLKQPLEPNQLVDDSGAQIAVFDSNRRRLAGTLPDATVPDSVFEQALSGSVEGSGTFQGGDQAYIAAYSGVDGTTWSVVALQPREVAERVAVRMRQRALTALGVAGLIVALLVTLAYRSLVRPLRQLLVAQRRLAKSRVASSATGNLIDELQKSFEDLESRLDDQRTLGEVFLGRYQVLELVGRGGMGTVFRGWDPNLERYVALKTVRFDKVAMGSTNLVDALLQEAKTTARMQHPNVVQVFDVASASRTAFVAMEFVDGISLEARVHRGLMAPDRCISLALGIVEGLGAAHRHQILHRDIKAANVLLGYDGSIKVTDFGLARLIHAQKEEDPNLVFGTPGHIAPEVLLGTSLGPPSDLFAVGVVLHYVLLGYTPFRAGTVKETLRKTLKAEVKPLSYLRSEIPKALEALLLEMLATNPELRPTADQAVSRLRAMQVETGASWEPPDRGVDAPIMPSASAEFINTQQIAG